MSTTVTYKGNTITTVNNNTKTLTTAGKYLEANVILTDITGQSGGDSGYTRTVVAPQQTVTSAYSRTENIDGYFAEITITEPLEEWSDYIITLDDEEYYATGILMWGANISLGIESYFWNETSGKSYSIPFGILYESGSTCTMAVNSARTMSVKIEKIELTGSGGGGDEPVTPTETLLGQTPYTLTKDETIRLKSTSETTYSIGSGVVKDFDDRENQTLTSATLTDQGTYWELADNGGAAWYSSEMTFTISGLTANNTYTARIGAAGDGTTSIGGHWLIYNQSSSALDSTPLISQTVETTDGALQFTPTESTILVRVLPSNSYYWEQGIKTSRFSYFRIEGEVSGTFTGSVDLGQLSSGTTITSTPSCDVYAVIGSSGGTLRGKTCVCLGDSVTGLMAPPNDYPSVLASNTGMTVINGGFEGCRMSDTHPSATYAVFSAVKLADAIATGIWTTQDANISGFESGSYAPAHLTALKAVNWSNVDYITVEFGGNDAGDQYVYIDNASNPTDTTTYVGAARYVYNRIHTAYPNIKIMFFVPMYRYWISEGKDSDEMTFTLGGNTYHYYDWGDALIASPPASGVPVIDMYRTLGINATNRQTYLLTSDQTHPSVAGCELIAQKFQTELTNHFLPSGGGSSATLITKTITANGTYSASDDNADGYSEVTVNLPVTWETKTDQDITISFDGTYNYSFWTYTEPLQANETYRITWGENGTQYICQTVAESAGGTYDGYFLGNASIVNLGENTGEPFLLYRNSSTRMVVTTTQSTGSWHVKVEKQVQISATLTTKTITENGTYTALNDSADGYSEVIVNVSSGSETTYDNIVPLQTINCNAPLSNDAYGGYINPYTSFTEEGEKYRVIFDGTTYEPITATYYGGGTNYLYVGDPNVEASSSATLAYPFEVMLYGGQTFYLGVKGSGSHTLQVDKIVTSGGSTNPLSGKILSTTGDSIVAGAGNNGSGYPEIVASDNSMTLQNVAVGGGTVAYVNANTFCISRSISSMRSDADFVLLEGGGNDADSGVPLGTLSSGYTATLDDTTFAGAIESMFKAALARFPDKKIGYVFIHKCASGYDSRVPNSYYDIAKSACEKWGIPYLDLNTQVPPLNYIADLKSTYTANGDGYHPNELGYRTFYVPKITAFLNTMLVDKSLTSKTVTESGTYLASDDGVDGYSSVTVNIESSGGNETTRTTIVPEQTGNYTERYNQINFIAPLVVGEVYIYTIDGVESQSTAFDNYGTVGLGSPDTTIGFDYGNGVMYLSITDTTMRTTHTVKIEQESSSGGSSEATLITKTITSNGTYDAEDDSADGYSSVIVNVTPNLQSKSTTPTTSSQTISPDSGYDGLSGVTIGAIPSQYIVPTGSLNITSNNTYDVTNYASAVVNIPSGWTKIAETTYSNVSTTSTTAATVGTFETGHSEIWTSNKILYIRIRDTAGKRAGYFYGLDGWFVNMYPANSSTTTSTSTGLVEQIWSVTSANAYAYRYGYGTTGYGVYPDTIYSDGRIRIRKRYNQNYSLTVNGTYKVEVYLLDPPSPIFG